MAKKTPAKTAAEPQESVSPEPVYPEPKTPISKLRGPRGTVETARLAIINTVNPKRPGSHAHDMWELYRDGMTVGEFCDDMDALVHSDGKSAKGMGTPALVYDTKHGFIAIEGYAVPGGVDVPRPKATPKPKPEKVPRASKGPKVETPVSQEMAATAAEVEAAVQEETVD